jgi:hypothetical protein
MQPWDRWDGRWGIGHDIWYRIGRTCEGDHQQLCCVVLCGCPDQKGG